MTRHTSWRNLPRALFLEFGGFGHPQKPPSWVGPGGNLHFVESEQSLSKTQNSKASRWHFAGPPSSMARPFQKAAGCLWIVWDEMFSRKMCWKVCWFRWSKTYKDVLYTQLCIFRIINEFAFEISSTWGTPEWGVFGAYFSCLMQQCILPLGRDAGTMTCPRASSSITAYIYTYVCI